MSSKLERDSSGNTIAGVDISAREHAQLLWRASSCGHVEGDESTLGYFEDVEASRYRQQNWQHDYFRFAAFSGKKVLEIGVGHGTDSLQFARGGAICHAIDITDKHIDLARRNFELRGLQIEIIKSDATEIPYPDAYFDCVYSFGVLHHIPEIEMVFTEINRVLKPGGTFYMALYNKWSFFHVFAKIFDQGILHLDLFRRGYAGVLATIERGADGVAIKPYVRLFSANEVKALLQKNWDVQDVSVWQMESAHLTWLARLLPKIITRFLDRKKHAFGWYVVTTALKRPVA